MHQASLRIPVSAIITQLQQIKMTFPLHPLEARSIGAIIDRDAPALSAALGLDRAEARLEVRILLEWVLKADRAWLLAHQDEDLEADALQAYEGLLIRRLAGEPIAYIVGRREFYGRPFEVGPDVLIPRPETELLVDLAKARLPATGAAEVLDLGSGSGCIAITLALERPDCRVVGVDQSLASLDLARKNAAALGARVEWLQSDWYAALEGRKFDLIVSNPPYIEERDAHLETGDVRFEPRHALASGPHGLDDLAAIIGQARSHLMPGGWLVLEHGWNQGPRVMELMKLHGFQCVQTMKDHAGHDRASLGKCR